MAALAFASPSVSAPTKRPCTWTAIIVAMRTVSPQCEMVAWQGRRAGLSAERFVELAIIAWGDK